MRTHRGRRNLASKDNHWYNVYSVFVVLDMGARLFLDRRGMQATNAASHHKWLVYRTESEVKPNGFLESREPSRMGIARFDSGGTGESPNGSLPPYPDLVSQSPVVLVLAKADLPDGTLPLLAEEDLEEFATYTRQQLNGKPEFSAGHQQPIAFLKRIDYTE